MAQLRGPAEEELSRLFARHVAVSNVQRSVASPSEDSGYQSQGSEEQPIKYSITQHYHHSAHQARSSQVSEPRSGEIWKADQIDEMTAKIILARNGVDPSALFPSQLSLFRRSDVSQQTLLVEIWRAALSKGRIQAYDLEFQQSSIRKVTEQQEPPDILHQEQTLQADGLGAWGNHEGVQMDTNMATIRTTVAEDTPQTGLMSITEHKSGLATSFNIAEPYMASGYEHLAQREYEDLLQGRPKESFSPLGSAVSYPRTSYNDTDKSVFNHATGPVYKQRSTSLTAILGHEDLAYQMGTMEQMTRFGALYRASHARSAAAVSEVEGVDTEMS